MAKFKSLLKTISVKPAGKKRKCYHDKKHSISKGEMVIEIKEGMRKSSGYCVECGIRMIEKCKSILFEIEQELKPKKAGS